MYIGLIKEISLPEFYHANTDTPFSPEKCSAGYVWKMGAVYDTAVDIKYSFDREHYVGRIIHGIKGAQEITLFVDGVKVAISSNEATVNLCGSSITIRARGNMTDMYFSGAEFYGFAINEEKPLLLPRPKTYTVSGQTVKIGHTVGKGEDGLFAEKFLSESLEERFESLPCGDGISLTLEVCRDYDKERYTVSVKDGEASVKGGSRFSLLLGVCRIIDLWDGGYLPSVEIDDTPDTSMRGFHMGLPERSNIDFFKKMIRYVLLPLGYNHVILEFNGDMRYDRHPKITEKWLESEKLWREGKGKRVMHADIGAEGTALEKSEVRELCDYIRSYGIDVIPEVQSLSHIEYITIAYPEFAELGRYFTEIQGTDLSALRGEDYVPEIPAEHKSGIHHIQVFDHCYCPSSKECMDIIRDVIDEVVEVVRPECYVHIGHDEVYHIGLCKECREKGGPRTYIEHVQSMYDYLKEKGLGTMLWSDMLHTDMYYTGEEYAIVKDSLPKDLVLLDFTWYYHFGKDIEDEILPAGFENVMMGNLYSSHYPRFKERISKHGMIGGEVSTWTAVSEKQFALNGKFLDLPYTAEMLWNAYTYDENDRASLTALIGQCVIPEMRALMHGSYPLYLADTAESAEVIGTFRGSTERVPEEIAFLGLSEPKEALNVGDKYDRLIFEHATLNPAPRICWQPLVPVGKYTVTYKDGEKIDVPVEYAGGVMYYGSRFGEPMPQQYYRHQGYVGTWFADPTYEGYTAEGKPILLLGQIWDNPRPDVKIDSISYTPDEHDTAVLLSAGVLGVKL